MAELFDSLAGRTVLCTFVQYLITFCSRLEAADDVISGTFVGTVVLHKCVKFHDPTLNGSREIPPKSIGGGIFDRFPHNLRMNVDNGVISGMAMDNVGMNVCVQFGDSVSNGFRDIQGTDFVSNE